MQNYNFYMNDNRSNMKLIIRIFEVLIILILLASCSQSVRFSSVKINNSKQTKKANYSESKEYLNNEMIETGFASYYADKFHGRMTSSGEIFDMYKFTAAHRTLPFGTKLKVTNIKNEKQVTVVVNDRGPFIQNRIIDLSKIAAEKIGMINDGIAEVKIEILKN